MRISDWSSDVCSSDLVQGIFSPGFIHELELLQLPEYELSVDKQTGQFRFETQADWIKSTWWEIHEMQIVNARRYRAIMHNFSRSELDIMYARAKVKPDAKLRRLAEVDGIKTEERSVGEACGRKCRIRGEE